ncbi:hypothetical protein HF295_04100 [Hujiaoplasma nucleasis]|uniref:Uncharacterized protein n=1 Tax=Hujiaoplasma nucleasis TaxID=2725268 RepID=A0A7L6N1F2_9MOLU|nr:hypothetical protein [Hujiaoplasma nucleasis]QLY40086.1 hypothetical protein HF295_04100 [Hujiaoplasma nucleasis]
MKALKTKVILSGIVLVFAFIATIGTTFAWFTVSQTATVDTMTLNVTSADSLLIMPLTPTETAGDFVNDNSGNPNDLQTAGNYMTVIEVADLYSDGYQIGPSAATPWRISPASVVSNGYAAYDAKNLTYLSDFENRTLASATKNNADGQYLELRFWVLLQGDNGDTAALELIDTSSIASNAGNSANQADIANAVRLVVWGDNTDFGGSTVGDAFVFGNGIDYSYTFTGDFAGTSNNTLSDLEATAGDLENLTNLNSSVIDHFELSSYTTTGNPTDLMIIDANVPTLVTVYIFVEGWDADATNNISLAQFDISFGFQIGTTDL